MLAHTTTLKYRVIHGISLFHSSHFAVVTQRSWTIRRTAASVRYWRPCA